jgi:hypothetical protein
MIVLGGLVVNMEGKTKTTWETRIVQATRIAPSLWPILFSGVIGNALRTFADWRLERGVPLMV